jgi:hypothetical protein
MCRTVHNRAQLIHAKLTQSLNSMFLVYGLSLEQGLLHNSLVNVCYRNVEQILIQNDHVGEFAFLDRTRHFLEV